MRARFFGGSLDHRWMDVPGARFHLNDRSERYERIRVVYIDGEHRANETNREKLAFAVYQLKDEASPP